MPVGALQRYRHVCAWGLQGRQDPPVLCSRVVSGAVQEHWDLQLALGRCNAVEEQNAS